MICFHCKKDKLSKEFPHEHLTDECTEEHPLLHCLRCVTSSVRDHQKCSQCNVKITTDNIQYMRHVKALEFLFPTIASGEEFNTADQTLAPGASQPTSHIVVTTLSGDSVTCVYNPDQTILELKDFVEKQLETPCTNQLLRFNDTELKPRGENNKPLMIKDFNVPPNSTIYLIVLLYAVPDELNHVIFDLFWGYPSTGRDYLDASVLLYSGSTFVEVIDYCHQESETCSAVKHSGDVMDDDKKLGHHTIDVFIKLIPAEVDKLVFTLSAWGCSNISKYPNPALKCFDAKCPDTQLCDDIMSHAAFSEAIIMCCLTNKGYGWQVLSLKKTSAGNAKNYGPLLSTIGYLIDQEFI